MKSQKFDIKGMTCSACSTAVDRNVKKLEGINEVNVNLLNNSMIVKYDENVLNNETIIKKVQDAGYEAFLVENGKKTQKNSTEENLGKIETNELKNRLIISFIFAIPLFYISMGHMLNWYLPHLFHGYSNAIIFAFTQFLLALPIVFINIKYYKVGFKTLYKGSPNMDSLIAIGTSAAMIYGVFSIYKIGYGLGNNDIDMVIQYSHDLYFESAAIVLTLITLGKFLEARAKENTSEAINKLINLTPKTALVLRNNQEIEIPIDELILKDIVIVKPGNIVPTDGIIIFGNSSIDESMLTGESLPVSKKVGDKVIGASINKSGSFKFEVTKLGEDTVLSQIIKLIEEASSSKAPISKLADRISAIFVPTVIVISILATVTWLFLGYSFEFALSIGIAILVISCPCALGLATPTAIMVGTGKGAQNGILIKSAESLEIAHTINTVVIDKTGTITEGKTQVTDIFTNEKITQDKLLQLCATIEKNSEHPLADAILKKTQEKEIELLNATDFEALNGLGIKAKVEDRVFYIGNKKLLDSKNISLDLFYEKSEKLANEAKTPIFIADESEVLGLIAISDVVKPTSKDAILEFEKMGLVEVIMLTGDNYKTANAIAKQININNVIAEVLPQDKEKEIQKLQSLGKKVAMIGDGINDAPALVRADVGIAIGAGTDIAIESANIVLVKSDLLDAVKAIQLSNAVIKNIKQNLFWAFFYNIIGIPLAAGVFYTVLGWKLSPMFAGAAMSLSSVTVVLNALRLKLFEPRISKNLLEKNNISKGDKMEKILKVDGMTCGHCKARVEKVVSAIDGVDSVEVDLASKNVTVKMSKDISEQTLSDVIVDAGYEVIK
ncbi:heavy metal translocating P-type ATPase [Aliarcobacter butzleri]|uniref:heavy metal translocating P-type ATPase n=1 Tax=Aliarcobacter butzleri TaxID=28197 RepID=UPI003AE0BC4C